MSLIGPKDLIHKWEIHTRNQRQMESTGYNTQEGSTSANALQYGYTKNGKVYRRAFLTYPEIEIGEVRDSEEFSLNYFSNRFKAMVEKVYALIKDIEEAANKGSYLMKLIHLRTQLETYAGIGDYLPLFDILDKTRVEIESQVNANRHRNLDIKSALIEELKTLLSDLTDWKTSSIKIKEIKDRWLKTGALEKGINEEKEALFTDLLNEFYDTRKAWFDEKMRVAQERMALYDELFAKTHEWTRWDYNAGLGLKQLKEMKEQLKEIGPVPKPNYLEYKERYRKIQKDITRNLRNQKRKRDEAQIADGRFTDAIRIRESYITKAIELQQLDTRTAFPQAKELQAKWRDLPKVPDHTLRMMTEKFTYATDRVFEMSYLMRSIYTNNRFFNSKSLIEQYSIKISTLKHIIAKDEQEVAAFEVQYNAIPMSDRFSTENKALYGRWKTQQRKLGVKKQLLTEMQAQLSAL